MLLVKYSRQNYIYREAGLIVVVRTLGVLCEDSSGSCVTYKSPVYISTGIKVEVDSIVRARRCSKHPIITPVISCHIVHLTHAALSLSHTDHLSSHGYFAIFFDFVISSVHRGWLTYARASLS